ncbi:unnamed protein product [Lathyrus sativus]|nr:unnamed protein product [Lathyrus sativus]
MPPIFLRIIIIPSFLYIETLYFSFLICFLLYCLVPNIKIKIKLKPLLLLL